MMKAVIDAYIKGLSKRLASMMRPRNGDDCSNILYHYTTVDSALAILNSGNVWASHIEFTNDSGELKSCQDQILELTNSKTAEGNEEFWRSGHVNKAILLSTWNQIDPFIFSLSEDGNKASQWRSYGAHGYGLALGFDVKSLRPRFVEDSALTILKVQYSKKNFEASVNYIVKEFDTFVRSHEYSLNSKEYKTFQIIMHCALLALSLSFKTRHHSDESEYRILYYQLSSGLSSVNERTSDIILERKFRATGGALLNFSEYIAPYVEIPYVSSFPITKVITGPRTDFELIKHSFSKMPVAERIEVTKSDSGVR